jgi:hexosaminidase
MRLLNTIALLVVGSAVAVANPIPSSQVVVPIDQSRLMPAPASMTLQNGQLRLGPNFRVAFVGHADARLNAAVNRMVKRLTHRTGIELPPRYDADPKAAALVIECKEPGNPLPALGDDESYTLDVTRQNATLKANLPVGVLRGLETLLQLVEADPQGFYLPAVSVSDKPRFPWRGLHIDTARHFQPVEVIKRNLDAMAVVKLNVFHWHVVDDQGFRIESKKFPKLHEMGSDGLFYTQDEVRDVVQYAADRGIRVVAEFDMPAHTTAWFVGMPELASLPRQYAIERQFGVFDPVMDPTREETYRFLREFLKEMTTLFPDAYIHVGGDENTGRDWKNNPRIVEYMTKNNIPNTEALQTHFNQRVAEIVEKLGKKMVGWDEILAPGLPKTAVVQSWRGTRALAIAAKQGHDGILSAPYYLDNMKGAAPYYLADPMADDRELTPEQAAHILGGETCMWAESLSPETVEHRIWPRAAAIAERFWSPRDVRDVEDMYRRLAFVDGYLEEAGLQHKANSGRMLRRLAASDDITALQQFADVVQLYSLGARDALKQDTQQTPLTRFGDSIPAEPSAAREVPRQIVKLLMDPKSQEAADELLATFKGWKQLSAELRPVMENSPQLRENLVRANELDELADVGTAAVNILTGSKAPSPQFLSASLKLTDRAAKGKTLVHFPWLNGMRLLIAAAAEAPALRDATPEERAMRLVSLDKQYTIHETWHW